MNQFFKFLFASCLGTALALLLLFFMGAGWVASMAGSATEKEKVSIKANTVLELDFSQAIPDMTNNIETDPFALDVEDVLGVHDVVKAIRHAKGDADIKGIFLKGTNFSAGKATAATIRSALADFKASGKFIVAYAHYYTQDAYYLASVADSVLLNPIGGVDFRGYASTIAFFKDMLDRLDVKMRIFYAGKFKSATEPFRLDKMSPENKLQIREYMQVLYDHALADISGSRGMSPEVLKGIADTYAGSSAEGAQKARLVDQLVHEDGAYGLLRRNIGLGEKDPINRVGLEDYYSSRVKNLDLSTKDKIAVVYAEGTISDGTDPVAGGVSDGAYVKLLRKIRQDKQIKAVVLRINSPGGSVLASENIFREVLLCKEAGKPVVVSMGDVAASGGYYIGCQADSIFAEPNTLTGSIGVFGVIPILQQTLQNKFGIRFDTVRTGKFSAFGTPFLDFSPEEERMIQARINDTYEDFLQKVGKGRKMTRAEVDAVAQGRVWAGTKALEIGLVDGIGNLDRALSAAAKLGGVEKYRVAVFPKSKTTVEQLLEKLMRKGDKDDYVAGRIIRSELRELYPFYRTFRDMRQQTGIQMRLPFEVVIR
jgi:protease-4